MATGNKAWYVLRAISGKEAKVKEVLDAAIKNTDLGKYVFQVLIPTEKVVAVRNGKKVTKERNLYSGYVFVEADLRGEVMHELRNTTNVIDFLKGREKDARPETLREADVMRMTSTNRPKKESTTSWSVRHSKSYPARSAASTERLSKSIPRKRNSRSWSRSSEEDLRLNLSFFFSG